MATSQNGWPALEAGSPRLYRWAIPTKQGVTYLLLRQGSAGFLLAHFALWYSEVIEPIFGKALLDDWGWAFRPIRGQVGGYSNHASGTAMDLNATQHPLGRVGTLAKAARVKARLAFYRGTIRAGAFYEGRKDEMHYEIDKPLPTCEAVARRLMRTPRGRRILAANPSQRAVILS